MLEAPPSHSKNSHLPLYAKVLLGAAIGTVLGLALGDKPIVWGFGTRSLGELGMLVIRVLKALAAPLVFLAVLDAVLKTRIPAKKGLALVGISLVNALVAVAIGFSVGPILASGDSAFAGLSQIASIATANTSRTVPEPLRGFAALIPENLVEPFRTNGVITLVLMALIGGVALRSVRARGDASSADLMPVEAAIRGTLAACIRVLQYVLAWIPLAVGGVLASAVGQSGLSVLMGLLAFAATIVLGLFIHAVVYYGLLLWVAGRMRPLRFWKGAADAIVTAFSCGSSLATLPVTLGCLEKMKISTSSARLAACVGTNLNHDGIILYEAAATLFIAHAIGLPLSLGNHLGIVLAAVMAGIGIAGVPEAGLITLPLVLGAGGIPSAVASAVVPLLLPVDWLIGRARAATNVASDMTVAVILDRFFPEQATSRDSQG